MLVLTCFCIIIIIQGLVFSSSCPDGYFRDKKCIPCPEHCLFCNSNEQCLSCVDGFWGIVCELPCSKCQPGTSCEMTNGFCLEKCKDGYTGILCDAVCNEKCLSCDRMDAGLCEKCTQGFYGDRCDKRCSKSCNNTFCNASGHCTFGCESGYWGTMCEKMCQEQCQGISCNKQNGTCIHDDYSFGTTYDIITRDGLYQTSPATSDKVDQDNSGINETTGGKEDKTPKSLTWSVVIPVSAGIMIIVIIIIILWYRRKKRKKHEASEKGRVDETLLQQQSADDNSLLKKEKCAFKEGRIPSEKHETVAELCAPHIIASPSTFRESHYVTDFTGKTAYIICKEPTKEDASAFMNMVWDEECGVIVTLNWTKEETPETKFWLERNETIARSSVTLTKFKDQYFDNYIYRTLYMGKPMNKRQIVQMQFLNCSSDGFPEDERVFLHFLSKVFGVQTDLNGPLLVHCSDGTGCNRLYIALDMILKKLERQDNVPIVQCLDLLRAEGLISSQEQYNFLVRTIAKWNKSEFKATSSAPESGLAYADV